MTLADAVRAAASGDEAAATALFQAVQPALSRWLRATEPRAAEDLAGETWAAVAAGAGRFDGTSDDDVRAWVFGIARRRLADHRRRGVRRAARRHEADAALAPAAIIDPSIAVTDAMSSAAAISLVRAICSEAQAEVILLRVVAGLDVEEVAAVVGRSAGAVRVLQHRGLQSLAAALETRVTP